MHILYLHQYYCPEGGWGNDRSRALARAWVAQGHRVTLLTSTASFPPDHPAWQHPEWQGSEDGIDLRVIRSRYRQSMGFWARLWAFRKFQRQAKKLALSLGCPDVLYASSTPLSVGGLGRWLAQHWQRPWVLELVDVWPQVPIEMGILRNPLLKWWAHRQADGLYAHANQVVVLSMGMAQQVNQRRKTEAKRVHVVVNGTDVEQFRPNLKSQLGDRVEFIYAGHMGRANHVEGLVRCLAPFLKTHPKASLSLVGDGALAKKVQALVNKINLPNLRFEGALPKSRMPERLARAQVGVVWFAPHKVLEANSANKFFDYLAAGLPVLLNYQGWQHDVLQRSAAGKGAPVGDDAGFRALAEWLFLRPEVRSSWAINARQLAKEHYHRPQLALQVQDILLKAVKEGPR